MIILDTIQEEEIENKATSIVQMLIKRKETIATMESCTGGALASEITNIRGASEILKESYITYCNEAKIRLGVSKDIIDTYSVYSKETAIEMAKHASIQAHANWGIGITGQLGRIDPANPGTSDNTIYYAVTYHGEVVDVCQFVITKEHTRKEKKQLVIQEILKRIETKMQSVNT